MAAAFELEHAIGFAGGIFNGLQPCLGEGWFCHPAGSCVVLGNVDDPHEQVFLRGHDDDVSCVATSASGEFAASGQIGNDSDVLVWDLAKRELLFRFEEHDVGVTSLAFSDDERLLASVGHPEDGQLILWDLATGAVVSRTRTNPGTTSDVVFGGMVRDVKRRETGLYQLATVGVGGIVLWAANPITGETRAVPVALAGDTSSRDFQTATFDASGLVLFAGSASGELMAVDVRSQSPLALLRVGGGAVSSILQLQPQLLAVGCGDGRLVFFEGTPSDMEQAGSLDVGSAVTSVSPEGDEARARCVIGTAGGDLLRVQVTLRDERAEASSTLLAEQHGPAGPRAGDGVGTIGIVASSSAAQKGSRLLGRASAPVVDVAFAPGDSDTFATAGYDNTVRVWDAGEYSCLVKVPGSAAAAGGGGGGHPMACSYSVDLLLSAWEDGQVRGFSAVDGEHLWSLPEAHRGGATAVAISRNQRFFVTGGQTGGFRVWELRSRELVSDLREHGAAVTRVALYEDDAHALSCSMDKTFVCWDLRAEKRISSHSVRMGAILDMALTSDQSLVMTVGQDRAVSMWDLREPQPVQVITPAHGDAPVTAIATGHNRDLFATGGADAAVRLWDIRACRVIQEGEGHSARVNGCAFAPDDRQLVSVGSDGCVMVWNVYDLAEGEGGGEAAVGAGEG